MQVVGTRKGDDGSDTEPAQVLHGCRQLVL